MRVELVRAAAAAATIGIGMSAQAASLIYSEVFPIDTSESDRKVRAFNEGWVGAQQGGSFNTAAVQDGQIAEGQGNTPEPGFAVNSNPVGPVSPTTGNIFYSRDDRRNVYVFTEEFSFPLHNLVKVQFDSRNSTNPPTDSQFAPDAVDEARMRLFLRIDGVWHVSETGLDQITPGEWQTNEFDFSAGLDSFLFKTAEFFDDAPTNATVPRFDTSTTGVDLSALPSTAVVDAFGIHVAANRSTTGNATLRYDNFEIYAIPTPTAFAGGALALGLFGGTTLLRRRDERS